MNTLPPAPQIIGARSSMGPREFVVLMAMSMALQALAIDAMLPALAGIAQELAITDPNQRQLIVGVFLLASGLGALIPGSLADRYGRRPIYLFSVSVFVCVRSPVCHLDYNGKFIHRYHRTLLH